MSTVELRLRVPQSFVDNINDRLRKINGTKASLSISDIGKEALGVYKWYVEQLADDLKIGAAGADGILVSQATTPSTPIIATDRQL